MKKYSKVHNFKYGKHINKFRYNFEEHRLEYVYKPDAETIKEIEDDAKNCTLNWLKEDAQESLTSIKETGYAIITYEYLRPDSWKNDKEYYMDIMSENIACECGF